MLRLEGVSGGYGRFPVLHAVSLEVRAGEIVALIGANGAGKSTLLNTIMGLVRLSAGEILYEGKSLSRLPTPAIVRAGLAQVPERRQLFGTMTVEENLRMGAYARPQRVAERLAEQFRLFPLLGERRRQAAQTLSGGEQQMLAIARANMSEPRLLLLDEPSLGLAPLVVQLVLREIRRLREAGRTVLVVEQNARAALGIADRGYVLENGRVSLAGEARELLGDRSVQQAYLGGEGGSSRAIEARIRARRQALLGNADA
jgi:branched-chain amino acid transport system ATP-binding protein